MSEKPLRAQPRSGVMRRLGLDYETLAPSNSGLIYVSMSGFGHSGPRRDWTSMNMNLQGYSGLMLITGELTRLNAKAQDALNGMGLNFLTGL